MATSSSLVQNPTVPPGVDRIPFIPPVEWGLLFRGKAIPLEGVAKIGGAGGTP